MALDWYFGSAIPSNESQFDLNSYQTRTIKIAQLSEKSILR